VTVKERETGHADLDSVQLCECACGGEGEEKQVEELNLTPDTEVQHRLSHSSSI